MKKKIECSHGSGQRPTESGDRRVAGNVELESDEDSHSSIDNTS